MLALMDAGDTLYVGHISNLPINRRVKPIFLEESLSIRKETMSGTPTLESPRFLHEAYQYDGNQVRSLMYLVAIETISGRKTPIRQPEDDGTAQRAHGYPDLPLIRKGWPVPTSLIGFTVLRSRRTVMETLTSLEARGLITSTTGGRTGTGKYWKATKRGKVLCQRLLEAMEAYPDAFPYDAYGFDKDNFDAFGVNYNGYDREGKYVGIHHIFHHYYGDPYFGNTPEEIQ